MGHLQYVARAKHDDHWYAGYVNHDGKKILFPVDKKQMEASVYQVLAVTSFHPPTHN